MAAFLEHDNSNQPVLHFDSLALGRDISHKDPIVLENRNQKYNVKVSQRLLINATENTMEYELTIQLDGEEKYKGINPGPTYFDQATVYFYTEHKDRWISGHEATLVENVKVVNYRPKPPESK